MRATVPQTTCDPVYGSPVEHEEQLAAARAAIAREETTEAEHARALRDRDRAVRAYYAAAQGDASQNELARRVGLNPSTFRSIIRVEKGE